MATGKNISNLSSILNINNNDTAYTLVSNNNDIYKVKISTLISFINLHGSKLLEKYLKYTTSVDYIITATNDIKNSLSNKKNKIDNIFNLSFIDKIYEKITSITDHTNILNDLVDSIVPNTDSVEANLLLIQHLNETYNLPNFVNIVKVDNENDPGLLEQYKIQLSDIHSNNNELYDELTSTYNIFNNFKLNDINNKIDNVISCFNNLSNFFESKINNFSFTPENISDTYVFNSSTDTSILINLTDKLNVMNNYFMSSDILSASNDNVESKLLIKFNSDKNSIQELSVQFKLIDNIKDYEELPISCTYNITLIKQSK